MMSPKLNLPLAVKSDAWEMISPSRTALSKNDTMRVDTPQLYKVCCLRVGNAKSVSLSWARTRVAAKRLCHFPFSLSLRQETTPLLRSIPSTFSVLWMNTGSYSVNFFSASCIKVTTSCIKQPSSLHQKKSHLIVGMIGASPSWSSLCNMRMGLSASVINRS